mmetsp:Transcript_3777/g.8346  ORF Transcript_3777/g.8346 Transcript_3777/m.8346 type:complete len:533 (-) Transcript_3777:78-1676(-)|eukprot:CAMPEP_0183724448 /NCGR_PEP_ID=MMETSP0737-20130205/17933_1 /TAXON_ID=385413 /ORGANISM="Thalassiosira miniscula, Strain CCMP1093" /LENGTH=532 /DNA_ID=CAMNT_0025955037 /DNA_START=45 /DNA_END=1643 /DNA_ORIENTATION=-
MAKSKRNRAAPAPIDPVVRHASTNPELTQEAIDRHWDVLPPEAKGFILGNSNMNSNGVVSLTELVNFWSSPQNIQATSGNLAGTTCGATWYLALVYLKLGMFLEARALAINGSFIHQCFNSSIEYVKQFSSPSSGAILRERDMPYFISGIKATRSPDEMDSYIRSYLPEEYTHMMKSFANLSSKKSVMGYVGQISDDWKGTSSSKNIHHRPSSTGTDTQIKLILVDNSNGDEGHCFDIGSATTLKALFNDYADKRGISLRSLRFSYAGKTLFLSSAGNKTPEKLGMQDQDVIIVHDTSKSQESSDDSSSCKSSTSKKTKSKKRRNKKTKGSHKKPQKHQESIKSLQEYKLDHSNNLTKLHEEAESRFRLIRQRLNNLVIERNQPKKKSKRPRTPKNKTALPSVVNNPSIEGLGGKAGKSHYYIHVGEVQNLYKTTKPSAAASQCSSSSAQSTLDMHGCTREEALKKLDESLEFWNDAAMKGSYPFVQPAVIVCGCGNQILSEVVENWIHEKKNVANAPKAQSRRRGCMSRAA